MHPHLKKNSLIDIVAPGFGCSTEELQAGVRWLENLGFRTRVPKNLLGPDLLHSNSDAIRAKHLITAFEKKDSEAIWFLRGGYGSNRLLPFLKNCKPHKKILIGISDITSLHSYAIQKWKWSTFHGPLLDRIAKGLVPENILAETLNVITGKTNQVHFENLVPLNQAAKTNKKLTAAVVGGNLKVIESHLGTKEALKFQNKIVMFEEIGERAYRVDRMLFHFEQAGAFKNCKAVVLGHFIQDLEPEGKPSKTPELLKKWASLQSFPVLQGLECGHDINQRILPLGTKATLQLGKKSSLIVPTGVKPCE